MDFDLSKENIQPLRGGRNVTHLEVALQAQSDSELQKELLQQKESFEEAIRTYEGDDPLENWYNYIYWVEQSYPKHGHEGNLVPLLEDCLSKFENEEKYIHDRRLCKLWIKYIDLQQNPLELFQLLHSKGICVSCADLFRAWAYYHEVAGDHKRADAVFELGISALAQPYEDLVLARNNMYTAIGRQAVTGVDERRLVEQRHALTSLRPFIQRRTAMVPSVRTGSQVLHNTPGVIQQSLLRNVRASNAPITLYEDQAVAGPSVGGAGASVSILDVARRQEVVHKENALKPGQWNSKKNIISSRVVQHRDPSFKIHVDDEPAPPEGLRLPPDFAPMNHDDFSTWQTQLYFPEPINPNEVRMYPRHLVYAEEPHTEYSPEEIRARKWFARQPQGAAVVPVNASVNMQETIMEEANIMNVSKQTAGDVQAMPTSGQSQSYPLRPSVVTQNTSITHQQQHTSSQFIEQAGAQQHITYQNTHQIETATDAEQYHHVDNAASQYSEPEVRPTTSQYQVQQSFNTEVDQRHSAQYQNYNHDVQNMRQSSQYYPEANTQSFRQSTQYQQQNYATEMQNQSVRQQSMHNYSISESGQSYPPVQKYNTEPQNESEYQQPVQNYQSVQQSYPSKNMALYQDQPNTCAETYAQPRQSYVAEPTVPVYQDAVTKANPPVTWSNNTLGTDDNYTVNMREAIRDINDIWKDNLSTLQEPLVEVKKPEMTKFQIHEDTKFLQDDTNAHKPVVKSTPFTIFTDETSSSSPVVPKSARKLQEIPRDSATASSSSTNEIPYGPIANSKGVNEIPYGSIASSKIVNEIPYGSIASSKGLNEIHTVDGRNSRAPFASQPLSEPEFELPRKSISHSQPLENVMAIRKSTAFQNIQDTATTPTGFNETCTTQMFNFNVGSTQAHSTPFHYKKAAAQQYSNATIFANDEGDNVKPMSKKVLFDAHEDAKKSDVSFMPQEETHMQEKLSVILETTKEYRSSSGSSSGGTTMKTTTFNFIGSLNVIPESSHQQSSDESALGELQTNNANQSSEDDKSTVNDYNMLKDLLRSGEDNEQQEQYRPAAGLMEGYNQNENQSVIDLTDDDSGKARKSHYLMRFNEIGDMSGFNLLPQQMNSTKLQKNTNQTSDFMKHFESPQKNQSNYIKKFESPVKMMQFYEHSNDSMSCSPVKGSRMHVDAVLQTQNSNSEFKMDYDSYQEAPAGYLEDPILQKAPSDPFANKLISALLNKVGFPSVKYAKSYIELQSLPRIAKKEIVCLGDEKFHVEKVIGKGAFGTVYKAMNEHTNTMVALKHQKPANKWEFYICKEIRERLANPYMLNAFMDVSTCYVSHNASILVSEFFKLGSLLDLTNKVKQVTGKGVKELVAIYYASEIITIMNALHQCHIIHADIKPDNFLVTRMPPDYGHPSLQLIDFGCSIDMSLFPTGTTFTKVISTENFTCTEMKDGRPWTYQTDMFCLAATVHVLLFEKYLQLQKRGDVWSISQNIPRYMRKDLWNTFFFQMLNIDGCDKLPDLNAIKASFDFILSTQSEELQVDMRFVANSIYGR